MRTMSEVLVKMRNALLAEADIQHGDSEAGEGGAENVTDVFDNFDNYIVGIVDLILAEYDMDEEEAVNFVFDVASSLEEDGSLPPIPDMESEESVDAYAKWLGAAATMQFGHLVMAALEAEYEEEDSETEE